MANQLNSDLGLNLDVNELRSAIQYEYKGVALKPELGFHFHTGRKLAGMLDYQADWLEGIPERAIESFAGTGNPFSLGELKSGENVVDVGSSAGIDSLVAAKMVAPEGQVIGVDMTPAMLEWRKPGGQLKKQALTMWLSARGLAKNCPSMPVGQMSSFPTAC